MFGYKKVTEDEEKVLKFYSERKDMIEYVMDNTVIMPQMIRIGYSSVREYKATNKNFTSIPKSVMKAQWALLKAVEQEF